ncbi:hypothetical protein QZH41_014934 [Actinostola sp. cb2023]|nr:hypothetical protein QZH41_014934 [Actinostola sp. cb2023]
MAHGQVVKHATLDHNYNVMRPQAVIQKGDQKGEGCFKISWSKVSKTFGASPVLEKKSYVYLREMVEEAIRLAKAGEKNKDDKARRGVMAPVERPDRQYIIDKRIELSRFN